MNNNSHPKIVCMIALSNYPIDPRIRRQAEALDEAGYEVDILCRHFGDQPSKEKYGNVTAYRIMYAPKQGSKIKYFMQSIIFLFIAFFRLVFLSIKRKYLIIQAHNLPDYLIFAGLLHKVFGAKLILDIHDPSVDLFDEKWPGKKNKILKYLIKKLEKHSCNLANHLITVTDTCKEKLVERGNRPDKITLILNTADEKLFKFNHREFKVKSRGVKLLYYGSIAERFGLHNAVSAMHYLVEEFPDSVLNIYGAYEDGYRAKLENLIIKFELSNNVYLNGVVNQEQIPPLIYSHDIGIVPYLKTNFMNLALPTKLFEYISSGIPVVSTKLDELSKTLDESCITYFEDSKPEEIAKAIKHLCHNPQLQKQQVIFAFQAVRQISGDVMKKRFVTLYDEMTHPKGQYTVTSSESSS